MKVGRRDLHTREQHELSSPHMLLLSICMQVITQACAKSSFAFACILATLMEANPATRAGPIAVLIAGHLRSLCNSPSPRQWSPSAFTLSDSHTACRREFRKCDVFLSTWIRTEMPVISCARAVP